MIAHIRSIALALAVLGTTPAVAAPITVAKTSQVVSDPTSGTVFPRAIPGAQVDYTVTITNPNGLAGPSVAAVEFTDVIPPNTKLRVLNYALLNPGPVSFNSGLSLLSYGFTNFNDDGDSLSFSDDNGVTWKYRPVADADGCDARVNKIRVVAGGNQLFGTSFSITFRVQVK